MDRMSVWHLTNALIRIAGILTTGAIVIFRPVARRLGDYLEARAEEMRHGSDEAANARLLERLEDVHSRLSRIEDAVASGRRLSPASESSTPVAF